MTENELQVQVCEQARAAGVDNRRAAGKALGREADSHEALAAEVRRLFGDQDAKDELLEWLDFCGEAEFADKLGKVARTPIPFAVVLLGEDSPRLERVKELLREKPKVEQQEKKPVPAAPPKLPLYKVVDLTDWSISGLEAVPNGGWSDEYKTTKLVLRRIEAGEFQMGDESSPHRVRLTQAFYIGVFAVTQRQWELVAGGSPSNFKGAMRPVESVSYIKIRGRSRGSFWPFSSVVDPDSFIGTIRSKTGCVGFDLPTEAQWEYACRAGTTGPYAGELGDYGWYDGNSGRQTHDVGKKRPNAWEIYDMHGNVWEWCLDWYGYYCGFETDPIGPASGDNRVKRGGSWRDSAGDCRSANRSNSSPGSAIYYLGFRLCCSAGPAV